MTTAGNAPPPGTECECCDDFEATVYAWTGDLGGFWFPLCARCCAVLRPDEMEDA